MDSDHEDTRHRIPIHAMVGDEDSEVAAFLRRTREEADGVKAAVLSPAVRTLFDSSTTTCHSWRFAFSASINASKDTRQYDMSASDDLWNTGHKGYFQALKKEFRRIQVQDDIPRRTEKLSWKMYIESGRLLRELPYFHQGELLSALDYLSTQPFTEEYQAICIYGLLLALDELLMADEIAVLRNLARNLSKFSGDNVGVWRRILSNIIRDVFGQRDI